MSSQRREVTEGQNNERKLSFMKNRNTLITATLCALAIALMPVADAAPRPDKVVLSGRPLTRRRRPDGGPV